MTDAEVRKQKARLSKLVKVWKVNLGLERWHFVHHFYRGAIPDAKGQPGVWDGTVAEGRPDFRYLRASIDWSLEMVAEQDDEGLQRIVIHELVHCLTDSFKRYALRELGEDVVMDGAGMELQVTEIQHALSFTYEAGIREGQRRAKRPKAALPVAETGTDVLD